LPVTDPAKMPSSDSFALVVVTGPTLGVADSPDDEAI
jgi:hypothetical protein